MKSFFESQIWPLKNRLYRFAILWLKDRDKAQDAVQETMTKGFVQQEYLSSIENPTGWMVKTLKNEALQQIREAGKWGTLEEENILFSAVEMDQEDGSLKEFYSGIQSIRSEKPSGIQMPVQRFPWQKLAAVLLFFLTVSACWRGYKEYEQQQQALAYQQVVEAMGKIQLNLRKGTSPLGKHGEDQIPQFRCELV